MLLTISNRLHSWAKGWVVISIFASIIIFMAVTLPLLDRIYPAAGEMESLDDPVFHTAEEVFLIIESWGESGRTYQLWFHLTWDLIFPIMGFLFVALLISWLLQRGFKPDSKIKRLNLVALGSVFDLLENICLAILIVIYPTSVVAIAWLKTLFTISKYAYGIPMIVTLLIGLIHAAMNRFKVQEASSNNNWYSSHPVHHH